MPRDRIGRSLGVAEQIAIIGGGAAGFFAAIACARANPENEISIYERGSEFLTKVRISGGGRCNVTHACFDPRTLSEHYPRGERALISPLHRFSPSDTVAWFEARGVRLKTESDGRMFPVTDSSRTIIDCLMNEAKAAGVRLFNRNGIEQARINESKMFELRLSNGETFSCDRLLLATGGARSITGAQIAQSLGHTIVPPVPSLFSLHVSTPWLRSLPGVSIPDVEVSASGTKLRERGPLLITHNGVSGPSVLRLSAWGARILHGLGLQFHPPRQLAAGFHGGGDPRPTAIAPAIKSKPSRDKLASRSPARSLVGTTRACRRHRSRDALDDASSRAKHMSWRRFSRAPNSK